MRNNMLRIVALLFCTAALFSCKKKESGVCYCHYFSGDKTEYNLTAYPRSQQTDSCYELDRLAEAFAGDCDLK